MLPSTMLHSASVFSSGLTCPLKMIDIGRAPAPGLSSPGRNIEAMYGTLRLKFVEKPASV